MEPSGDGWQDVDLVTDGPELCVEMMDELREVRLTPPESRGTDTRSLNGHSHQSAGLTGPQGTILII